MFHCQVIFTLNFLLLVTKIIGFVCENNETHFALRAINAVVLQMSDECVDNPVPFGWGTHRSISFQFAKEM